MPHYTVWIDESEALEAIPTSELQAELLSRNGGDRSSHNPADYRIPPAVARDTLADVSDILRKQGVTHLAYRMDEIREDYVQ